MSPNIYNYTDWIGEVNPEVLYEKLTGILEKSGYTIVNFIDYHFTKNGYTCVWLLAQSHLAVHTFPEDNRTYIELSGCNESMNNKFKILLREWFETYE